MKKRKKMFEDKRSRQKGFKRKRRKDASKIKKSK